MLRSRPYLLGTCLFSCLLLAAALKAGAASPEDLAKGDRVLYFASFSIPESSLRKTVEQAEKVGAVLVLRGLKNDSLLDTAQAIQALIGRRNVSFQIDPPLFRECGIAEVPCTCYRGWKVYGDVSLDYALEVIAAKEPAAERLVEKIRKGGFYER